MGKVIKLLLINFSGEHKYYRFAVLNFIGQLK